MNILVDTDILIDFTFNKKEILSFLFARQKKGEINLFINPIIITEFLTDQKLIENKRLEEKALQFLNFFDRVEITAKEGILVAKLLRERKIQFLGDAFIAATCLNRNLQLATRNKKHFQKVTDLTYFNFKNDHIE